MASALSEEEFCRLQTQLLELRETNYQLSDKCKRQDQSLVSFSGQVEVLDRELQKANKTINKSKKAKEFDLLLQENDGLQRKLQSQEEEFRLQNETLMQELGSAFAANEQLEKENQSLKQGESGQIQSSSKSESENEARRLQAQNNALQKNITESQEKYEAEISELKQLMGDLEMRCVKLAGQRGHGEGSEESKDHIDGKDCADGMDDNSNTIEIESSPNPVTQSNSVAVVEFQKEINELKINLDVEREENKLLKKQLQCSEKTNVGRLSEVEEELTKISEKLRKKQDSFRQLQEEKENIYSELSEKLEEVQSCKEKETRKLKELVTKLEGDVASANKSTDAQKEQLAQRIQELEELLGTQQKQSHATENEMTQQLQDTVQRFQGQLSEMKSQIVAFQQKSENLTVQLQEAEKAHRSTNQQLVAAQQDRDEQIEALQEANRVAEKRKCLLDEMAIKLQKQTDSYREQTYKLETENKSQCEELTAEIDQLKAKLAELEEIQELRDQLEVEVQGLGETKAWLERSLNETEETLESAKNQFEEELEGSNKEHLQCLEELREAHAEEIKTFEKQIENIQMDLEERDLLITKLRQEIKDGVSDKKIHEKKGASMLKDLKRQLHSERKRTERLQERLQELLNTTQSKQTVEELLASDGSDRYKGDGSSICSWGNTSALGKDSTLQSPDSDAASTILEQENNDLVTRIADLQQLTWNLEEKVSHLESSNSAMAEDILQKTAIIEHYAMISRIDSVHHNTSQDKITLKKVFDYVKDKGDENQKEINRKLQRMLEETLTKNMHLQKDLEMMSQELVKMSKAKIST